MKALLTPVWTRGVSLRRVLSDCRRETPGLSLKSARTFAEQAAGVHHIA